MDTVTILRTLWRHRVLVAAMCAFAVLAGSAVVYKVSFPPKFESRKYEVGVAQARILLDTPSSQVVDVAAKGSDSLGVRANLIASLMVGGSVKSAIAERAGLAPEKLIGITQLAEEPSPVADKPERDDFVLTTNVVTNTGGDQLPIIEVSAQAPTPRGGGDARQRRGLGSARLPGLDRRRAAHRPRRATAGQRPRQADLDRRGQGTLEHVRLHARHLLDRPRMRRDPRCRRRRPRLARAVAREAEDVADGELAEGVEDVEAAEERRARCSSCRRSASSTR